LLNETYTLSLHDALPISVVVSSIRHDYENQSDVEFFLHAIGKLWLSGADINWQNVHQGERRRRVPLPTYPFERQLHWLEPVRAPDRKSTRLNSSHQIISY